MPEIKPLKGYEQYNIPLHGVRLPSFSIPQEEKTGLKLPENVSNLEFLTALCRVGFKKLKLNKDSPDYKIYVDRVKYELQIIDELGFVDYFLLVWTVINFCKKKNIPTGIARGSCGGSLVLFLIGVTGLDPIKYDLYFERFISKTRAKKKVVDGVTYLDGSLMCDVDLDIDFYRRHEVIEYLEQTFSGRVSKILTLNTLSGKLLIKEVGKVAGNKSETEMVKVAGFIPKVFGKVDDISDAYENVPEFKEWCDKNKEIYEIALGLRDLTKNKGVHPSGIMISYNPLEESCPIENSKEGHASAFDMKWGALLNVKLDCLGLRTVSVINDVCSKVGVKVEDIDINDPGIYQFLYDIKHPYGIFQLEAHTAFKALQKIKPKNIKELSAVLAIARPGALAFIDEYANYTNNGTYKTIHPFFDDIFDKTGGQCLYQEQLIAAVRKIGFSAEEGEQVRRCVTGDTKFISKTRGFISINTLLSTSYKDDLFLTLDEFGNKRWQKISNIWSNGIKQTRYVEADNGFSVRASMYHQFLTNNGWKSRMRLKKGDFLYSPKSVDYDGEDIISSELAIVIAGLATEGYFSGYASTTFTNFDKYIFDLFGDSFYKEFGKLPTKRPCGKVWSIGKQETIKINKYLQYGLSASKVLPEIMMGMTKETTRKFLSFILACEGGISQSNIEEQRWFELSSKSEKFANQVHLLLLRFGIYSKLRRKKNLKYGWFYYVSIKEYSQLVKLKNELTILWPQIKKSQLDELLEIERKVNFSFDVIPQNIVTKLANQYPFSVSYESGRLYSRNINRETFKRLCEKSGDKEWINFCEKDFFFNAFKSQERDTREIEVFDFSMEDENSPYIIANGLAIHNCVGKKDAKGMMEWESKIKQKVSDNKLDPQIFDILWKIAQDSASYSFNACLHPNTKVETTEGIKALDQIKIGDKVKAYDTKLNKNHFVVVKDIHETHAELHEFTLGNNTTIKCSLNHKFLNEYGQMCSIQEIISNRQYIRNQYGFHVGIISSKEMGFQKVLDLEVDHPDHNFYAEGLVTSNSHSYGYAHLSAICAYLKHYYPTEFFLAWLNMAKHEPNSREIISAIEKELPHFGIKLLSPCILKSDTDFKIEGKDIRFGLCLIKGISDKAIEKLRTFKKEYNNKFELFHAAEESGVSMSVFAPLIQAGAFADYRENRSMMVLEAQLWNILTDKEKRLATQLGRELNYNLIAIVKTLTLKKDEKGKPYIKESRFETIKKKYEPFKEIYRINSKNELFANWYYERVLMGYSCAHSLLEVFEDKYKYLGTVQDAVQAPDKKDTRFVAFVKETSNGISKKGTKWQRFTVTDESGEINVMLFNDRIDEVKSINDEKLPKEDDIIYVAGRKIGDAVFADMVYVENNKIYVKLGAYNKDIANDEVEKS